jgi:hypothetical protein
MPPTYITLHYITLHLHLHLLSLHYITLHTDIYTYIIYIFVWILEGFDKNGLIELRKRCTHSKESRKHVLFWLVFSVFFSVLTFSGVCVGLFCPCGGNLPQNCTFLKKICAVGAAYSLHLLAYHAVWVLFCEFHFPTRSRSKLFSGCYSFQIMLFNVVHILARLFSTRHRQGHWYLKWGVLGIAALRFNHAEEVEHIVLEALSLERLPMPKKQGFTPFTAQLCEQCCLFPLCACLKA